MSRRNIGLVMLIIGLLAIIGELFKIEFPTARWFFQTSREVAILGWGQGDDRFVWFGWLSSFLLIGLGGWVLTLSFLSGPPNPVTLRKIRRFKEIKRGYYSYLILMFFIVIAALDQVVVGNQALAVKYEGKWYFPAFTQKNFKGADFGIEGDLGDAPVNYRMLKKKMKDRKEAGRVILPLIPFAPTNDTLDKITKTMVNNKGKYEEDGVRKPYSGLAGTFHNLDEGKFHLRYTLRKGVLSGPVDGWDTQGELVYRAEYSEGEKIKETFTGKGNVEDFLKLTVSEMRVIKYNPAPPIWEEKHWLGTTSQGFDVVAYLYGGLQVNFKAALIFLPIVYIIGITLGMLMGYLGGWFDLVADRVIEVFSNMPFLFVVIIFSSFVPDDYKGLPVILTILILFGWMGISALMRTAAYRDKERDYIAAARVLGAGTPRIIFRHLLPNTVATIVTLVPFTMSGLVSSLTALDYLGFGLPPQHATWGRLLNDGLANLSAPWLVSSAFFALVALLVLITFIGEAVREAFDPKKHTYYR